MERIEMPPDSSASRTVELGTIRELLIHNDWGRDRMMDVAATLSDAHLDQPFEMGEGSLRATLRHLWGAEQIWLSRWQGLPVEPHLPDIRDSSMSMKRLWEHFRTTAVERDRFANELTNSSLTRPVHVTLQSGEQYTFSLGDTLLHVINHGIHHRAQAVNMLRRVGAPPFQRGLDYIFMKIDEKPRPPAILDHGTIAAYLGYADWAMDQVGAAAAALDAAKLDRAFEMGLGTLRRTLMHITDAEAWWLENYTRGPSGEFPALDESKSAADAIRAYRDVAARRNKYLAGADLKRPVEVHPRPDVIRRFPFGCVMLQLCCHGVLHRAQAVNMLRHLGAPVPELDYLDWVHILQQAGRLSPA